MSNSNHKKKRAAKLALTFLAGLLSLAFLAAGGFKLTGPAELEANFIRWGLPLWFLTVTGLTEVAGALLLAIPKTRFFGAVILASAMIGGVGLHWIHGELVESVPALLLLLLSAILAVANRDQLGRLIGRFRSDIAVAKS